MNARLLSMLAILCFASFASGVDQPKDSNAKMKETLRAIVDQQLAAFRAGDYPAAYRFADASIQSQVSVEAFEKMVKVGYPVIADSASAEFGLIFDNGEEAVVSVRVTGQNQKTVAYQYLLKRTGETWAISGVFAVEEPSIQA